MDNIRQQVMISQLSNVAGCHPEQAKQLLTDANWQFETALSMFLQDASNPTSPTHRNCNGSISHSNCHFSMCAPANTPVTPPNFPDTLAALARMTTTDGKLVPAPTFIREAQPQQPTQNTQASSTSQTVCQSQTDYTQVSFSVSCYSLANNEFSQVIFRGLTFNFDFFYTRFVFCQFSIIE